MLEDVGDGILVLMGGVNALEKLMVEKATGGDMFFFLFFLDNHCIDSFVFS